MDTQLPYSFSEMLSYEKDAFLSAQETTCGVPIGARLSFTDGTVLRYVKFGANFTRGHTCRPPAIVGVDVVKTNTAAENWGTETIAIKQKITPNTAPAWTATAYKGCWLLVDDGTGENQVELIRGNDADNLYMEAALTTALTVAHTDDISFVNGNPFNNVIVGDASTGVQCPIIGFVPYAIADYTATPYGWIIQQGFTPAIIEATNDTAMGYPLTGSSATAGEIQLATAATDTIIAHMFIPITDSASDKYAIVIANCLLAG